jgi:hypothetical protein
MKIITLLTLISIVAVPLAACNWGLMEKPGDGEVQEVEDPVVEDGAAEADGADAPDRRDQPDIDAVEPGEVQDVDLVEAEQDVEADDGPGEPDQADEEPEPVCGNGILEEGEECDDGTLNSDTTPDACRLDCTNPGCGDGVVDSSETCDNASGFCVSCQLTPPSGWVACTTSDGQVVFLMVITDSIWSGNHTWDEFRDYCRTTVEGFVPEDYQYYGLAVFSDSAVWDCISGSLSTSDEYCVGLRQDPFGSEPNVGWSWIGFDGSAWINIASFPIGPIGSAFNDSGGDEDCVRLVRSGTTWQLWDYPCTSSRDWDGICMIQF